MFIEHVNVYFLPGHGADHQLFNKIELPENFQRQYIEYHVPKRNSSMKQYAFELAKQIDTTRAFHMIGTSLGGMLASELTEIISPVKTIIISSAKCRSELPWRYRFQKQLPIYKTVPPGLIKLGAQILQPLVEPDRNKEAAIFKNMLSAKDPVFMKRAVQMIITWDKVSYSSKIVHIHGNSDHTLPIENINADVIVKGGSHMITLTKGEELSEHITKIFSK